MARTTFYDRKRMEENREQILHMFNVEMVAMETCLNKYATKYVETNNENDLQIAKQYYEKLNTVKSLYEGLLPLLNDIVFQSYEVANNG